MTVEERYQALAAAHRRLRLLARAAVDEASDRDQSVPPHRIRDLRRELEGEPLPSGFATMSVT